MRYKTQSATSKEPVDTIIYKSKDGFLEYSLILDAENKISFEKIAVVGSPLNSFGIRSEAVNAPELLMPRWEYSSQIPARYRGQPHPDPSLTRSNGEPSYYDAWAYIREMPEIRRWYKVTGVNGGEPPP
jgi:hypothetical protein